VKNLEGEVSNIQQSANKISLSVTGGLGSTASIILDVNGNKQTEDLDLSPFDRRGGLGRFYEVFGEDYERVLMELNLELVA
jgi:hypothetical protein